MSVYFLSHESPTMWDTPSAARTALLDLAKSIPRPKQVVVATPHWLTKTTLVSTAVRPETIHDFGGFPKRYYNVQYPAPGAPEFAEKIIAAVRSADILCDGSDRGFDHATWQVCGLMWPEADIPITQLSLQPHQTPEYHFKIGQALKPLVSDPEVLLIATGTWTHNLGEFFSGAEHQIGDKPYDYAIEFSEWMHQRILSLDIDALLTYRRHAPHAYRAHPTPDHILGLFVALGAAMRKTPHILHHSYLYGILAMSHIEF